MEHLLLFGFGFRDVQRYLLYFDFKRLRRASRTEWYNRLVLASRGLGGMIIGLGMMLGLPALADAGWATLGTALIAMLGMPCGSKWIMASRTYYFLRNCLVTGLGLWCWSRALGFVTW